MPVVKEQYSNNVNASSSPYATLGADIDNAATSLTVSSASLFPAQPNFTLVIDSEILLVTGVSGTTFTVSRGQEGSTAAAHSAGANVDVVWTNGSMSRLCVQSHGGTIISARRQINLVDGGGVAWTLTDDPVNDKIDISASVASPASIEPAWTPPVLGDFTWTNQGSATVESSGNNTLFMAAPAAAGSNSHILRMAVPATPWRLIVKMLTSQTGSNYNCCGPCFLDTATGLISRLALLGAQYQIDKMNSPTSFNLSYLQVNLDQNNPATWFKLADDGTNRTYSISVDGTHWILLRSMGRTDFLTNGANAVGWFCESNNSTLGNGAFLCSWDLGSGS